MKIVGHGVDLVEIASTGPWGADGTDPVTSRCFLAEELAEIDDGPDRIEHLAGRFAAKEAVLKALGTGFGNGIAFSDVQISRLPGRPPTVRLTGGAERAARELGITSWQLSITYAGGFALASAIAVCDSL